MHFWLNLIILISFHVWAFQVKSISVALGFKAIDIPPLHNLCIITSNNVSRYSQQCMNPNEALSFRLSCVSTTIFWPLQAVFEFFLLNILFKCVRFFKPFNVHIKTKVCTTISMYKHTLCLKRIRSLLVVVNVHCVKTIIHSYHRFR